MPNPTGSCVTFSAYDSRPRGDEEVEIPQPKSANHENQRHNTNFRENQGHNTNFREPGFADEGMKPSSQSTDAGRRH
jgi:hypothetical protein